MDINELPSKWIPPHTVRWLCIGGMEVRNWTHPSAMDDLKSVTHLLVVDITSKKGLKLLLEGIRYLIDGSKNARIGVLFNANENATLPSLFFMKVFQVTASTYSHKEGTLQFLDQLCLSYEKEHILLSGTTESYQSLIDKVFKLADANGLPSKGYESALAGFSAENVKRYLNKVSQFLYRQIGLEGGVNAVITNGRVIQLLDASTFLSHDLHLLESLEFNYTY